jgi:hypothetical protein
MSEKMGKINDDKKTNQKKEKIKGDKKPNKKRRKNNKTLSQKK